MTNKIEIPTDENKTLSAVHGVPEGSSGAGDQNLLIIMSHGFPGHKSGNSDIFGDLEYILVDKGHHTLRFDYRGCGESDGRQQDFTLSAASEDFKSVTDWAKEKGYDEFVFIGEGLGATICIMNSDLNVKMMALFWPVLDMKAYGKNAFNISEESKEKATRTAYLESGSDKVGVDLMQELRTNDLSYALKEVFMPVLLVHGAQDEVLPMDQLDIARKNMRSKRIEITTFHDGTHGLPKLNHRKMIFYHTAQFLGKYV